jgi:Ca2+-binding EF-hand superfamily protein
MSVEKVFKTVDDNSNGIMDVTEFNEAVSLCYRELSKHEVDVLFKHFDKRGVGNLSSSE